jgi:hypothetical protein
MANLAGCASKPFRKLRVTERVDIIPVQEVAGPQVLQNSSLTPEYSGHLLSNDAHDLNVWSMSESTIVYVSTSSQ